MKPDIEWTDDCTGKKDYDGSILEVLSRYWPTGGGFYVLDPKGFRQNQDGSKPSATSSLIVKHDDGNDFALTEQDFEGETLEDVQAQVEAWVAVQFSKAVEALRAAFPSTSKGVT